MTPEAFRALVKEWRRSIKPAYRSRTKAPTMGKAFLFPQAVERRYAKMLTRTFRAYSDPIMQMIRDNLDQWLAQSVTDGAFFDQNESLDDLESTIDALDQEVFSNWVDPKTAGGIYVGIQATVNYYGWEASDFNLAQWKKVMGVALPDAYPMDEQWVPRAIEQWSKANVALVDKAAGEFYNNVESLVQRAVFEGRRAEEVRKDLQKMQTGLTRNKAKLIARDQIGTLNGILTQKRNQDAGLNLYKWSTSLDERVRGRPGGKWAYSAESHWVMQDKLCRWDDATVYSTDGGVTWQSRANLKTVVTNTTKSGKKGASRVAMAPLVHPSIAINCRCTSIPFLDNLIATLDAELENEPYFGG